MPESLKDIIARLKQQHAPMVKQEEPQAKPIAPPKPSIQQQRQEIVEEQEDEEDEEEEEVVEVEQPKQMLPAPAPPSHKTNQEPETIMIKENKNISEEERVRAEVELLYNEGIYRRELLINLNTIKDSLLVIAGTLAKLTGEE